MQKHEDGSATLTAEELSELNKAYQHLYTIISDSPVSIGDYCEEREQHLNIMRWREQLRGRKFDPADYE